MKRLTNALCTICGLWWVAGAFIGPTFDPILDIIVGTMFFFLVLINE